MVSVILDDLDGFCRRGIDAFQQCSCGTDQREHISRGVVFAVCVAILAKADILVAVHDLDVPMRAVEAQKGRGARRIEAGDQIGGLDLGFHDASGPDMITLAGDACNGSQRRPRGAHGFGQRPRGQERDGALVDATMPGIGWGMPWFRGKKRGLEMPFQSLPEGLSGFA